VAYATGYRWVTRGVGKCGFGADAGGREAAPFASSAGSLGGEPADRHTPASPPLGRRDGPSGGRWPRDAGHGRRSGTPTRRYRPTTARLRNWCRRRARPRSAPDEPRLTDRDRARRQGRSRERRRSARRTGGYRVTGPATPSRPEGGWGKGGGGNEWVPLTRGTRPQGERHRVYLLWPRPRARGEGVSRRRRRRRRPRPRVRRRPGRRDCTAAGPRTRPRPPTGRRRTPRGRPRRSSSPRRGAW